MSLLGAIVLSLHPAFCGELESASITFIVIVPENTASDAKVYVADTHAAAEHWQLRIGARLGLESTLRPKIKADR